MTLHIMTNISDNSTGLAPHMRGYARKASAGLRFCCKTLLLIALSGCTTLIPDRRKELGFPVTLPFMRMEPGECYYLDDFMPTPDSMVAGKSAGLYLRYYTFSSAIYKVWEKERVMLAFFSRDNRCWSLFEEYSTGKLF